MPKTLLGKKKIRHEKLAKLLWGEMGDKGVSPADLGCIMGVSANTARRRMNAPGEFTLDELLDICRGLDIPIAELREAITFN